MPLMMRAVTACFSVPDADVGWQGGLLVLQACCGGGSPQTAAATSAALLWGSQRSPCGGLDGAMRGRGHALRLLRRGAAIKAYARTCQLARLGAASSTNTLTHQCPVAQRRPHSQQESHMHAHRAAYWCGDQREMSQ